MTLPIQWEVLRRSINDETPLFGTVGIRDPDAICEEFDGRHYDGHGKCHSDGHYMCEECSHLSPDAPRFQSRGGRMDRLRLFLRRPR